MRELNKEEQFTPWRYVSRLYELLLQRDIKLIGNKCITNLKKYVIVSPNVWLFTAADTSSSCVKISRLYRVSTAERSVKIKYGVVLSQKPNRYHNSKRTV